MRGGFHKPNYALCQTLTLCAVHLCCTFAPKKASQKFRAERKMASSPTFSLYEIYPWKPDKKFAFSEKFSGHHYHLECEL